MYLEEKNQAYIFLQRQVNDLEWKKQKRLCVILQLQQNNPFLRITNIAQLKIYKVGPETQPTNDLTISSPMTCKSLTVVLLCFSSTSSL